MKKEIGAILAEILIEKEPAILPFMVEVQKSLIKAKEYEPAIMAYLANTLKARNEAKEIMELLDNGGMSDFYNLKPVSGMTIVALCSMVTDDTAAKAQALLSEARVRTAKNAADTRHNKPGGSREKADKIRATWATGKYTSRDICAEQECAALNMSFSAARKALRNTPDLKK